MVKRISAFLLALLHLALLFCSVIQPAQACRQELAHLLLVDLVFWVLLCTDLLGKPGRGLEQDEIRHGTNGSPVVEGTSLPAAPLVDQSPDALLGEKVGVSAPSPEAGRAEAPV